MAENRSVGVCGPNTISFLHSIYTVLHITVAPGHIPAARCTSVTLLCLKRFPRVQKRKEIASVSQGEPLKAFGPSSSTDLLPDSVRLFPLIMNL